MPRRLIGFFAGMVISGYGIWQILASTTSYVRASGWEWNIAIAIIGAIIMLISVR